MNVNTMKSDGLGGFFENLGKKVPNFSKKMANNVLKILDEPWI